MHTETKTCKVKREGSNIRLTVFVECPPTKAGAHLERDMDSALPADTIAFRLVVESAGGGLLRPVEHLEPNVPSEVTKVRFKDEASRQTVVRILYGLLRRGCVPLLASFG